MNDDYIKYCIKCYWNDSDFGHPEEVREWEEYLSEKYFSEV